MFPVCISPTMKFNSFPKKSLVFTCLKNKSLENTVRKGEILLFLQCFLPIWRTFFHFHLIYNCRLQTPSVWKSLKFVVWEWVKMSLIFTIRPFLRTKTSHEVHCSNSMNRKKEMSLKHSRIVRAQGHGVELG